MRASWAAWLSEQPPAACRSRAHPGLRPMSSRPAGGLMLGPAVDVLLNTATPAALAGACRPVADPNSTRLAAASGGL
jgi:hypothetical protein